MISLETFLFYTILCILAPIFGAFMLSFTMFFETRIDVLKKETARLSLERELEIARNQQLSQQIQPHFFFNTLNTILVLARLNRRDELIDSLEVMSNFFKYRYEMNDQLISLHDEIQYTDYYLDIQKLRFSHRLQITKDICPTVDNALIPPYLLQTLVENAFKHGFEKIPGPAILQISIFRRHNTMHISVWNTNQENTNKSMKSHVFDGKGLGLENIKSRLDNLFPNEKTSLELKYNEHEGLVLVQFPFK